MAEVAPLTINTTTVDVDFDLLQKEQPTIEKEDASLDATLATSCDSSQDQVGSSCDADSVQGSLESPIGRESKRVSFSNVEVRGEHIKAAVSSQTLYYFDSH